MKVTRQFKDFFESEIMGETEFNRFKTKTEIRAAYNSTYPKGGVLCSKDTFVQAENSVLRIKFCGKSPAIRVAANRQTV